jgi:hypothetical protein
LESLICLFSQSVSQSVTRRPATSAPVAPARSTRSEAQSGQTPQLETGAPHGRSSHALSLPGRSGLAAKAALGVLALAAQAQGVDALKRSETVALLAGLSGAGVGGAIGFYIAGIHPLPNRNDSRRCDPSDGALFGVPCAMFGAFFAEMIALAAGGLNDPGRSYGGGGGGGRELLPTARQATEAAASAASQLFNAAHNNPGTTALVALAATAFTAGVAYATRKTPAESTPDSARLALTADHAV